MNLNIEKYIPKRNKFLISNKYQLLKKKQDNFHHVIYFINKNKIEVIVRNLNHSNGWDYDLKLKFSNNILSIGSSSENCKIIELYTNFEVSFVDNKELYHIPKTIIQTYKTICKNLYHYNSVISFLEKNPNYDYIFFDDIDSRKFIQENFIVNILDQEEKNDNGISDVLKSYDLLKCGALKADLFRYCYLYVNGGIYIDSKINCHIELDKIINSDDKLIICSDDAKDSLYNGIMIMEKNNFYILNMIKDICNNVFLKKYYNDIHEPTGNKLYYKFFKNNDITINKVKDLVYFKKEIAFNCIYKNYYNESDYEDFRVNYKNKNYYYYYSFYLDNLIFKFSNDIQNNIFSIFHLKDNIYVLKNNSNNGWDIDFILDIYDVNTNICKNIKIYKNNDSEFVFSI